MVGPEKGGHWPDAMGVGKKGVTGSGGEVVQSREFKIATTKSKWYVWVHHAM